MLPALVPPATYEPPAYVNAFVEGSVMTLVQRDEQGKRVEKKVPAEWVTYFRLEELSPDWRRVLRTSPHVKGIAFENLDAPGSKATKGWVRVSWVSREARYNAISVESPLRRAGLKIYEGDVHPVRRFFSDTGARIQRPKRIYLDIETDSRVSFAEAREHGARVLCWTLKDDEQKTVAQGVLPEDSDAAERKLLIDLWQALDPYDQVLAWSSRTGETFDFIVIFARSEKHRIRVNAKLWLWLDHLTVFMRMNSAESGEEKVSMKLGDVATAILGDDTKHPFDASKTYEEWAAGGDRRQRLVDYNAQDTNLLPKIEKKTGFLELFMTLCEVCRVFPDTRGLNPMGQVDGFLLNLGVNRGHHFPTKYRRDSDDDDEQFAGAYVKHPEFKGIAHHVHVADFASLYPSIIISWNMSPETRGDVVRALPGGKFPELPPNTCWSPLTGVTFRTDVEGILPFALKELIRLRKHWNDLKASLPPGTKEWHEADLRATAYKVAANSFYGVMGAKTSRYFDPGLAESVTQNGVWLIKAVEVEAVKQLNAHVGYIDTDSTFVKAANDNDPPIPEERFREFTKWCNDELFPRMLKEARCLNNSIKLAYEKECKRIVFTSAKRYVAIYEHYKGKRATKDSKPEIKGLEYRRSDQTYLARKLQKAVIDLFCTDDYMNVEKYDQLVIDMKRHVLQDELPLSEVQKSAGLSKGLDAYAVRKKQDGGDMAQPAHIEVAKVMRDRGEEVMAGTRIAYVVVDSSNGIKAIPASDYDGTCDRFYLWDLVYPPTMRLLEAMFPSEAARWNAHEKVRPPKVRRKRSEANPNQIDMFASSASPQSALPLPSSTYATAGVAEAHAMAAAPPPAAPPTPPHDPAATLAVPARRTRGSGPYKVAVHHARVNRDRLLALKAIVERHPGPRAFYLSVDQGTAVVELDLKCTVSGSPEMQAEVAALFNAASTAA